MLCPVCVDNMKHSGTCVNVRSVVLKPKLAPELPEGLVETQVVSGTPKVSD